MHKVRNRMPLKSPGSEPAVKIKINSKLITVLLISGEHRVNHLMRKAMAEAGSGAFIMEYTDRLSVGLERLARGGIDVLLLDSSVLGSHGLDSVAWERVQAAGVPIIMLSTLDDEVDETVALQKGVQEYLVKGKVDGRLLVRSISRAIVRYRLALERKRKIQRLESSEAHLNNIIRSNPYGIIYGVIIVDDRGIVRFANQAVESLFGCKAEQLLGETLDFLPAPGSGKTELGIIHGDGEKGIAEIQVVETQYQGKAAHLVLLCDITERKQAEEEARLAREEAGAAKTASEEAMAQAEKESQAAKEALRKLDRIKREKTVLKEAVARAEEETRLAREEAEAAQTALEKARTQIKEKSKAAKEALRKLDRIKYEKTALKEAVARAEEEARLAREEAEAAQTASEEAVAKAEEDIRLAREEAGSVKAASQKTVAKAKEAARLAREEAEAAKLALEEAVAKFEEELRDLDPMQSEFMSNIVHELRAPLHSITGFTKLLIEGGAPDPGAQREFLTIIADQSEHLRQLIDELVDISPAESKRLEVRGERMPIKDLLRSSVRELYSVANKKNIVLNEDIPETLPEVEVDGQRLRQVMFNLLSNAIKFSDDGGNVNVKAEVRNGELLVQVTDQGIGIAEEDMPSIFNKFYQAKNQGKVGGLGLGLYISKQIIETYGGRIWAESSEGESSTFSFTLPLTAQAGGRNRGQEDSGY
jgi:nitrogen-specific signal transduction histidine kinase/CheY-like chemotaxis protein